MKKNSLYNQLRKQKGTSLIEVLVTLVILALGLLGLVGLQTKLQVSEMESYQRAQALILLNDMANRIANNREHASDYATLAPITDPLGVGFDCSSIGTATRHEADATEWCDALQGAGEVSSGSSRIGAMLGGRGCVEDISNTGDTYLTYRITIAWQGMAPISEPPDGIECGSGEYNGGACGDDERCRRTITTIVRIADLS